MTTTQESRYRVCERPVGAGRDLLLDRAVTTVRLAHDRPERLARALRSRGAGPWLHVLDAFEQVLGRPLPAVEAPRRPGDAAQVVADTTRLRTALGWKPRHDDVEAIVRSALDWEKRAR